MKPIRPAFWSRKDCSDQLTCGFLDSEPSFFRMLEPPLMKVDNELQFRDAVDKNLG